MRRCTGIIKKNRYPEFHQRRFDFFINDQIFCNHQRILDRNDPFPDHFKNTHPQETRIRPTLPRFPRPG